jgi:plasmid stabilization system protein ParE
MRKARLKPEARADIRDLLKRSRRIFGPRAKHEYKLLIDRAVDLLCTDPHRASVQHRVDLRATPYTFHVRHARTRGAAPKQARHIIIFTYDDATLTILRVLHDSMDISERVGDEANDT